MITEDEEQDMDCCGLYPTPPKPMVSFEQVASSVLDVENKARFLRYRAFTDQNVPLTVKKWAEWFSQDGPAADVMRLELSDVIKAAPFEALNFEVTGVSRLVADTTPFEFVVVDAPLLASHSINRMAACPGIRNGKNDLESAPRAETRTGATFFSLHSDDRVVEARHTPDSNFYSHLSAFLRSVPREQVLQVWKLVAANLREWLESSNAPVWLSTRADLTTGWLQFRLSNQPRFCQHMPFTQTTSAQHAFISESVAARKSKHSHAQLDNRSTREVLPHGTTYSFGSSTHDTATPSHASKEQTPAAARRSKRDKKRNKKSAQEATSRSVCVGTTATPTLNHAHHQTNGAQAIVSNFVSQQWEKVTGSNYYHQDASTCGGVSSMNLDGRGAEPSSDSPDSGVYYAEKRERKMLRYSAFDSQGRPVSIHSWAVLMAEESPRGENARTDMMRLIEAAPFKGMFFETKGATEASSVVEQFEFVLIDSPSLHSFGQRGADMQSFSEHFHKRGDKYGVCFHNLRKDAKLIAPRPLGSSSSKATDMQAYSHFGQFVRGAPEEQVRDVFRIVAVEYLKRLRSKSPLPVWLSTSGLGVAWLHFRLDSSPKYYQHRSFAQAPTSSVFNSNNRKRNDDSGYRTASTSWGEYDA